MRNFHHEIMNEAEYIAVDPAKYKAAQDACSGCSERGSCKDVIVKRGQAPPCPGERRCWSCGLRWILKLGEEDVCPRCGRPNVIPETSPPQKIEIVLKHRDETTGQVLQRSAKLLKQAKGVREVPLTVGDLSCVSSRKRSPEEARQHLRTMNQGLSIGDRSIVTDNKDSIENQVQRAQAEKRGLTVGDLSGLYRDAIPQPTMSPSQEILSEMQAVHRKKRQEVLKIQEYMFNQQQEKAQREAEGRSYADSPEFKKDLKEAIRQEQAKRRG